MITLPCGGGTLPSKADYVNVMNQITKIPSDLEGMLVELRTKAALQDFDLESELQTEIDKQINDITEQINDIKDTIEGVGDILSPWWQKGQIRDWEKEAEDAFTELIQDYHIFIPMKIMDLISSIIPLSFTVPILGLNIDVLKISTAEEQERLKAQIMAEVDKFYAMVPEKYRYFDGEFGVICDEWKGKLTWSYIKNEIMSFVTGSLHELFGKLIDKFKEIWDALGLPSLPALLDFDIESWIRAQVEAAKAKADREIERIKEQAEQLQSDIENFDMDAEISKVKDDMLSQIKGLSLPFPAPFNISIQDVIGGDIEKKISCVEDEIHQLTTAARDFFENAKKGLLFDWVKIVKKFFDAVGLGAIFDFIDLTFCDVLGMIGVPTSFDVSLPELPSIGDVVTV